MDPPPPSLLTTKELLQQNGHVIASTTILGTDFRTALSVIRDDSTDEEKKELVKMTMRWGRKNYPEIFSRVQAYDPPAGWIKRPFAVRKPN